jgi:hypothetical protein
MSRLLTFPWHFIEQLLIDSRVQLRPNSENLLRWLSCRSVRGLVCLFLMNVTLAHISLPIYLNSLQSTHGFNSERTQRTYLIDCTEARYVDCYFLFVWMSRFLTFDCHSIWTDDNQLKDSIPSELGELTALTELSLGTCISLSFSYECHIGSHFSLLFYLNSLQSTYGFNSERTRRTYCVDLPVAQYVDWFIFFLWMSHWLTFPCHYIWTASNQLTGSIPSELGKLTALTYLSLSTWIGSLVRKNGTLAHISLPFYLNSF